MYFYITLHCIGYFPSMPLSRHQGPTIPYHPPSLGPIPLLRVPSSSYSLLLTASLYDPVSGSNSWNPCTHVHPCQGKEHEQRGRRTTQGRCQDAHGSRGSVCRTEDPTSEAISGPSACLWHDVEEKFLPGLCQGGEMTCENFSLIQREKPSRDYVLEQKQSCRQAA